MNPTLSNATVTGGCEVFEIGSLVTATISGLTVENGLTESDGGGITNRGTLTLSNVAVTGNTAAGSGGGINNSGTLTVSNSTLSNNTAGTNGGGIFNCGTLTVSASTFSGNSAITSYLARGGGIYNSGVSIVGNSTFANNSAVYAGGGIYSNGTFTSSSNTISSNSATQGGGIYGDGSDSGTLTLVNTILAANTSGQDLYNTATLATTSNNLIGAESGNGPANGINGNLVGVTTAQVGLASLAASGGPTETTALLPGSLALGGGAAVATLASALTVTATSVSVNNASLLALVPGTTVLQIDSEQMLVTASTATP